MSNLVTWLRAQLDEDQWHAEELRLVRGTHVELAVRRNPGPLWHCVDPERLLAEVEAKRLLLGLHKDCDRLCYIVRVLALPYAGRPGFRVEWRP